MSSDYALGRVTRVISFPLPSICWEKNTFVDGMKKFYPEAWYQQMKVISQGEVKRHQAPQYYHSNVGRKNLIWSTSCFQSFQIIFTNSFSLVSNSNSINDGNPKGEEKYLWQYLHLDSVLHLIRHIYLIKGIGQEALSQKTIKLMVKSWTSFDTRSTYMWESKKKCL